MASWWLDVPESRLSQGDVVVGVPLAALAYPPTNIHKQVVKGGLEAWVTTPAKQQKASGLFVAKGSSSAVVLVLSHGCELDKDERKGRVVVCEASPAERLNSEVRDVVFAQRRISLMPLPAVPGHGDYYADIRTVQSVDRRIVEAGGRAASMTAEARTRLQTQLAAFFARDLLPSA